MSIYSWLNKQVIIPLYVDKDCKALYLEEHKLTNVTLSQIGSLTNLITLNITNTGVTDTGLTHLTRLTNLKTLYLRGNNFTNKSVDKLRQALPNCEILI